MALLTRDLSQRSYSTDDEFSPISSDSEFMQSAYSTVSNVPAVPASPLPCLLGTWMPVPVVLVTPLTPVNIACKLEAPQIEPSISAESPGKASPMCHRDPEVAGIEYKTKQKTQVYSRRGFPIHPMPQESEEVWSGRTDKRQAAVTLVQRSQEYKRCVSAGCKLPPIPDAFDRSISKRQWEGKLMRFRDAVKALSSDLPPLAATEEEVGRPRWADMLDGEEDIVDESGGVPMKKMSWADMVDDEEI